MSERHRFRFFVDDAGEPGARIALAPVDARHAQVLRLADGDLVEAVDTGGIVWESRYAAGEVELVVRLHASTEPAGIELVAGALSGSKFDELVDAAVQAGASLVTPLVTNRREEARLRARRARLERIARAAAKQSKRSTVPVVADPVMVDALPAWGIVVDPSAPDPLDRLVDGLDVTPIRLLIGGAEGFPDGLVEQLVDRGWKRGRLGPTILRAELAAPVAVAIAAMHAPPR